MRARVTYSIQLHEASHLSNTAPHLSYHIKNAATWSETPPQLKELKRTVTAVSWSKTLVQNTSRTFFAPSPASHRSVCCGVTAGSESNATSIDGQRREGTTAPWLHGKCLLSSPSLNILAFDDCCIGGACIYVPDTVVISHPTAGLGAVGDARRIWHKLNAVLQV